MVLLSREAVLCDLSESDIEPYDSGWRCIGWNSQTGVYP